MSGVLHPYNCVSPGIWRLNGVRLITNLAFLALVNPSVLLNFAVL
jgi:hypothetical protein